MKLYNTLTRQADTFQPQDGNTLGMYVCGPTVYDHLHIGNVRPVIVFDTMRRYFETFKGWDVIHVQNITDIDDKLINKSAETGETVDEIARTYTTSFFELLQGLGVLQPTHTPRATEHVQGMIELIQTLEQSGYAYEKDGDVYFRVDKFEGYGKLSGRKLEEQEAGARIEASSQKENPFDFTLWKTAKPGEPKWDSPWGEGRPGWHTECVVLSNQYLGEHRDIHAGGNDLVFPHHENEIAQAEAASGKPFFRFWLHNGMLSIGGLAILTMPRTFSQPTMQKPFATSTCLDITVSRSITQKRGSWLRQLLSHAYEPCSLMSRPNFATLRVATVMQVRHSSNPSMRSRHGTSKPWMTI